MDLIYVTILWNRPNLHILAISKRLTLIYFQLINPMCITHEIYTYFTCFQLEMWIMPINLQT